MDVYRIGVKFFLANPEALRLRDLIPVFHEWIQKQAISGHLLIDVHDYSHIHWGPGLLLVAHEGNFSIDLDRGRPGLFYYRKRELDGSPEQRLASILKTAIQGCRLLEEETSLEPGLRFRTDEFLLATNDRLNAPNSAGTFAAIEPALSAVLGRLEGSSRFKLTPAAPETKERFGVKVETGQTAALKDFLAPLLS